MKSWTYELIIYLKPRIFFHIPNAVAMESEFSVIRASVENTTKWATVGLSDKGLEDLPTLNISAEKWQDNDREDPNIQDHKFFFFFFSFHTPTCKRKD